jgi:hypothetical protein
VRKLADRSARAASEIADLVQTVLLFVRKVAVDARDSLEMSQTVKQTLEKVDAGIQSIAGLSKTASEGVGQAEASMGTMLGLATDTSRKVDELAESSSNLHEIIVQVDRVIGRFSSQDQSSGPDAQFPGGDQSVLPLSLGITPVESLDDAAAEGTSTHDTSGDEVVEELEPVEGD